MMLIDPQQPVQPGLVSDDTLEDAAFDRLALSQSGVYNTRRAVGATVLLCEPFCIGAIDEAIHESYVVGAAAGYTAVTGAVEDAGWRVYSGPFAPHKERSAALKYGGAALVIGGAAIVALWPNAPAAARNLSATPTVGGMQVATQIGF